MSKKTKADQVDRQSVDTENLTPQPKCYSYIRFSTPHQIHGDSLRRQTALAEQWAKNNGYVLDDSLRLRDFGISGYSGANKVKGTAFGDFLEEVRLGRIVPGSILLVENLDRVSREQILDALSVISDIVRAGVKIVTLGDGKGYDKESLNNNPMDLMFSLMILMRGHEESATKSKRLKAAWAQKRTTLDKKKLTSRCPLWLTLANDRTEFHIIHERAKIIKRIFEMKNSGIGVFTIVNTLNQESAWLPPGRPSRKNSLEKNQSMSKPRGWTESYIQKILRFRAVIGEFQPKIRIKDSAGVSQTTPEGDPIPDYYPRVISDELFYAVQDQLQENQGKGGRNGSVSNLFGHIAQCGYCRSPMTFINKGLPPKGGTYLVCDRARRGAGCARHPIRYPEFEDTILEFCQGLDARDVIPANEELVSEISKMQTRLAGVRGKLGDLEAKADNFMDSIGTTSDSRVRERLEKSLSANLDEQEVLAIEEKGLAQSIKQLSSVQEVTCEQLNDIKTAIKGEGSAIHRSRVRAKLRQLISIITIYPAGMRRRFFLDSINHIPPGMAQQVQANLAAGLYDDREQRAYVVLFKSGNWRKIEPNKSVILSTEYDKSTGLTISISIGEHGVPIVDVDSDEEKLFERPTIHRKNVKTDS